MTDETLAEIDWALVHPAVRAVSESKFVDGYLADAVESALKEVNKRVKDHVRAQTGEERDGAALMNFAFSLGRPVITLDDLGTESGRNTQQGYMQIFAGAMTGIRNPKAHANITIEKLPAIHFLFLASLLMFKLDETNVPSVTDVSATLSAGRTYNILPGHSAQNRPGTSHDTLRDTMLLFVADQEDTGTNRYIGDKEVADNTQVDLPLIQRQLNILESLGFLKLTKAMGPSYGARLTPNGWLEVEKLRDNAKREVEIHNMQKKLAEERARRGMTRNSITGY